MQPGTEHIHIRDCSAVALSCEGKCQTHLPSSLTGMLCYCHRSCLLMGDCCFDYTMRCTDTGKTNTDSLTYQLQAFRHYQSISHCFRLDSDIPFRMINRCPPRFQRRWQEDCESDNNHSLVHKIPVIADGLMFKNLYCARCHGYIDVQHFKAAQISCPPHPINFNNGFVDPKCKVHFKRQAAILLPKVERFKCYPEPNATDLCDENHQNFCDSYAAPVVYTPMFYKNIFCASCDILKIYMDLFSCFSKMPPRREMSGGNWLFDFNGMYQYSPPSKSCVLGHRSPFVTAACQSSLCDNSCRDNNLPMEYFSKEVDFSYPTLIVDGDFDCRHGNLTFCSAMNTTEFGPCPLQLTQFITHMHRKKCFTKNIELYFYNTYLNAIYNNTFGINNMSINHILLTNYNPKLRINCGDNDTVLFRKGLLFKRADGKLAVVEFGKAELYNLDRYPVIISKDYSKSAKIAKKHPALINGGFDVWVITCDSVKNTTECNEINLNNSLSSFNINGDIRLQSPVTIFREQYIYITDQDIIVCPRARSKLTVYEITTMVMYSVSAGCLLCSLAIYSLNPSLQTLPGKLIMNLIVALTLAHLSMVINTSKILVVYSLWCHLLATIQHFTWLSSFAWMTIMSYDIFLSLSAPISVFTGQADRSYRNYFLIGWLIPMGPVIVCIVLTALNTGSVYYGTTTHCWFGKYTGTLYAFAIPVLCAVSLNIIFFIGSCMRFKQLTNDANAVGRKHAMKGRLVVLFKISSWVGVSWVFGVLANLVHSEILMYTYVLLTSLQGVHVFLAFGMGSLCGSNGICAARLKRNPTVTSVSGTASTQETRHE